MGAGDGIAGISTNACLAVLTAWAGDTCAGDAGDTKAICAELPSGAFAIAAESGAEAIDTSCAACALCAFVDIAIAIVVDAVADLLFRLSSEAFGILAIFASFDASAARGGAGLGEVFVDETVAIVVFTIADLRQRLDGAYTRSPKAVDAFLFASIAKGLAVSLFAVLAGCSATFIDLTITIVIEGISAKLAFTGELFANAATPLSAGAGLETRFADPNALCSSGAAVAWARFPIITRAIDAVVDLSVTIVVFAIADLRLGFGRGTLAPLAVCALLYAFAASRLAVTTDVFVNRSITVIIDAITGLGFGEYLPITGGLPTTIEAFLGACFTSAHALGSCGAGVTGAGFSIRTETVATFIDLAVAVVIDVIAADLGDRLTGAARRPCACATFFGASAASGGTSAGKIFIHLTIAIVVESIADLDAWGDLALAGAPSSILAELFASLTDTASCCTAGACVTGAALAVLAGASAAFINLAIAIVVDAISTDLSGGGLSGSNGAFGGGSCGVTDEDARTLAGSDADLAGLSEVRKGFVDLTIAIVVDPVAKLGAWCHFACTGSPRTVCTASRSASTRADALGSRRPAVTGLGEWCRVAGHGVVDKAVAIVIDAIAGLHTDLTGDIL